jgi:hypothetical protein
MQSTESYTDFQHARLVFTQYLERRIKGEFLNDSLVKRAQKLADNWWRGRSVWLGTSGVRVTGCILAFGLGTVGVERWLTRFIVDTHEIHKLVPSAVALGYIQGWQLYMADYEERPHLIARQGHEVQRWSAQEINIPPQGSPLFVALERAKALGYLSTLKGQS